MILPQQLFSCTGSLSSMRNCLIWPGLRADITPWLSSVAVTPGSFWILDAYSHLVPVLQKAISASRIRPEFCYGGLLINPKLWHFRHKPAWALFLHWTQQGQKSSQFKPGNKAEVVLGDAVWLGAGASSSSHPNQAASCTKGIQKPLRALPVADTQHTAGQWHHLFSVPHLGTEQQWLEMRGRREKAWAAHRESHTAQAQGGWFARVHKAFHMQTLIYWVSGHTRQDACTPQEYTQKHMHTHPKHTETVIRFVHTETRPVSWPRTHTVVFAGRI